MSFQGKTLSVEFPAAWAALNPFCYRMWSIRFKCGNCGAESTVNHDEVKNYHKCPVCKEINILDKTS